MTTKPTTDELTIEMVRNYLANLPDNDARMAAIHNEADAVVLDTNEPDAGCAALRFARTPFKVEQEYFTYVSVGGKGWYIRAAQPDERAKLP